MKTILAILAIFLILTFSWGQSNSINYKTLIKDGSGNILSNANVTLQLGVLQGDSKTNVYSETHTTTTDANGIAILNIDEGAIININQLINNQN